MFLWLVLLIAGGPAMAAHTSQQAWDCGDLANGYGPFDYRKATLEQKKLVEGAHFTAGVESLLQGHRGKIGADIDYTLRAFPNHPRALMAMVRLSEKEKRVQPDGARYTVDCYFDRAMRFAHDDPHVRLIYGIYLLRRNNPQGALRQFEEAKTLGLEDPNLDYNLGLAYFELGDYAKSLDHAKRAYALGFPLTGLREKLQAKGYWK
jgi:tetratricopeptide (TPR) repeat protein